jgi:HSP20 family protein
MLASPAFRFPIDPFEEFNRMERELFRPIEAVMLGTEPHTEEGTSPSPNDDNTKEDKHVTRRTTTTPPVLRGIPLDVTETKDAFTITAEMPGLRKEDIDIQLEKNVLTLRGQRTQQNEQHDENTQRHVVERRAHRFHRTLMLPESIDFDKEVAAKYENGVVELVFKKKEDAGETRRKIKL